MSDPEELGQLDNLKSAEEAVAEPPELLANFGPKEPVHVPQWISFEEFGRMFAKVKH
ncbi:hypothetical protein [Streptomyces sp. NRRL F-5630]|uniref:hypothetical protein n=1 Tax=Streptomyces sp. NRRL F-5630 TaxID=1463864 RepID=UPI000AD3856E|nr:hypothetical protein [Streptomyces sp. NRRL F-5630]